VCGGGGKGGREGGREREENSTESDSFLALTMLVVGGVFNEVSYSGDLSLWVIGSAQF
jgi:hypothetical protein